MKPVTRYAAQG